jgi:hypothetical protein
MEGPNQGRSYSGASGAAVPVGRVHGATKWTEKLVFQITNMNFMLKKY